MKKLKKLSVLALLAVGFALVFGGCSNGSSDTEEEEKKEEQKEEGKEDTDSEIEIEEVDGYEIKIKDLDNSKALHLKSDGSYKTYVFVFETPQDLSKKKIKVSYKTSQDYEDKADNPQDKIIARKDAKNASEVAYSIINKTTDWTEKDMVDFTKADLTGAEWSQDKSISALSDATSIKEIALALQEEKGDIYIRSISIVDVD